MVRGIPAVEARVQNEVIAFVQHRQAILDTHAFTFVEGEVWLGAVETDVRWRPAVVATWGVRRSVTKWRHTELLC